MLDTLNIWFIVVMLLLSAVATYAAWTWVRVVALQTDLQRINDTLFDRAQELNGLNDDAFLATRAQIQFMIGFARDISNFVFGKLALEYLSASKEGKAIAEQSIGKPETENTELQAAIDQAFSEAVSRNLRFMMTESFAGIVLTIVGTPLYWSLKNKQQRQEQLTNGFARIIRTEFQACVN